MRLFEYPCKVDFDFFGSQPFDPDTLEFVAFSAKFPCGTKTQITLKALSYFEDVNGITEPIKKRIQDAVRNVDLRHLPEMETLKP